VSIDMRLEDGGVSASVTAERPETLDLLRRHADALQRELSSAGFDRASLAFGDGGEAEGDGEPGDRRAASGGDGDAGTAESATEDASMARRAAAREAALGSERLDIRL
jgi:hypothetical protein